MSLGTHRAKTLGSAGDCGEPCPMPHSPGPAAWMLGMHSQGCQTFLCTRGSQKPQKQNSSFEQ